MVSFWIDDRADSQGVEHWITGGGKVSAVRQWVLTDAMHVAKGTPVLIRAQERRGRRVLIYRFPQYPAGGPNGGHLGAFVQVGDEMVFASLHGARYLDAAVEMTLDLAEQAAASRR